MKFQLVTDKVPAGDQPQAIKKLVAGLTDQKYQTLLGVTGSGKTFTMANVITQINRPTLVLSHNKTLAAQLHSELSQLFPNNKVAYFVSYFDYYQPESYLPKTDTYIEKDSQINEAIDRMRLDAIQAVLSRRDVIVVASVSCIYALGSPDLYKGAACEVKVGSGFPIKQLTAKLVDLQYERNDVELKHGRFRIKGDLVDIVPGSSQNIIRVSFYGDDVESITEMHHVDGHVVAEHQSFWVYPARPYVANPAMSYHAMQAIRHELNDRLPELGELEAYRLRQRTNYDLEMIEQFGYCKGIENYSSHFDGREPGQPPYTLLDFFPSDYLLMVDESHVSIPQIHGMHKGDHARKKNLIDYGFRLPSAYDNRPLTFDEFTARTNQVVFVSATPGEYELQCSTQVVEQIIRPTGLIDPLITIRSSKGQIDDLTKEINATIAAGYRVFVTTLTKRMAEELTTYFKNHGIKVEYLHSEIETLERSRIIQNLRYGLFDVLVGINLLREGLDVPEVALVAILDADSEGFLRNARSLIQTSGRAARNLHGRVIMYADRMTDSMKIAIAETDRRRKIQVAYNKKHGITPKSIEKALIETEVAIVPAVPESTVEIEKVIIDLERQMYAAAENLDFERATELRDQVKTLRQQLAKKLAK